jgi:phosphoglycolate phosphatase-like HAD superfamily hydrolase
LLHRSLLVFDFDGVLVDGMAEYWWSARRAACRLDPSLTLPERAPESFHRLRPRIHQGWEMVLVAAELGSDAEGGRALLADYDAALAEAMARRGWPPSRLQEVLEKVRRDAIASDRQGWLALHRFYPGVIDRLGRLDAEGADWCVLTTKGGTFAAELLAAAGLTPAFLFGHEDGSKPEVLARLIGAGRPLRFLEDRRPTLERVRSTPGLEPVRCYLVSWGYLGPDDAEGLPDGIRWLDPESFQAPLAHWP